MRMSDLEVGDVARLTQAPQKGCLIIVTNVIQDDRQSGSTRYRYIGYPEREEVDLWSHKDRGVKKVGKGQIRITIDWETNEEIAEREGTGESIPNR